MATRLGVQFLSVADNSVFSTAFKPALYPSQHLIQYSGIKLTTQG
jgi:hypothetical protein